MFTHCNIDKTDRINRIVIGLLVIIAALFGMSKLFFVIIGLVLIIQGLMGWCSIPYVLKKLKRMSHKE